MRVETDNNGVSVKVGDIVTIEAQGISVTGKVVYCMFWDHWDIELREANVSGGVSHWKQRYDGGKIISVNGKEA